MSASKKKKAKLLPKTREPLTPFAALALRAMRRAQREAARENARFGMPLIVEKPR